MKTDIQNSNSQNVDVQNLEKQTRRDFLAFAGVGTLGTATGLSAIMESKPLSADETVTNNTANTVTDTYMLSRTIPVANEIYDIAVLGGGPAGVGAAISAARLGAKVLLVESNGCLGGMGTSGLVTEFDPMANGEEMLVGGLMREIVETLYKRNFIQPGLDPNTWRKHSHRWTPFQVEGYKLLLDELTTAAGVQINFFTRAIDVDADKEKGTVNGVILHNIEGYRYVKAKTFIDATGHAEIADLCGAQCREAGVDTPRINPTTLMSLYTGIDWNKFWTKSQGTALNEAIKEKHFTQIDRLLPGMFPVNHTVGNLNGGHMFHLNALHCKDLTDGIMLGRRLAQEYKSFYQKYMPGCENLQLVITANQVGVRESRCVMGEYELNIDDYMARRKFPDQIGLFCKYVDIHPYDESDEEWHRFMVDAGFAQGNTTRYKDGESFGIPYGILVPKGWRNLWVAGRCASADVRAHGSIRVQPACSMMGQAAGTAAVQSIKTGQPANDLDTEMLVKTLRNAGANLPQETLSKTMTRKN
ncbi:MAG: FAD-dependent oxidoreductase [Planctomycetaceae bacterium]|nr:FAD-dependent oxidoreductase [Planctomycetaceae bacterium]